MIQLEIQQRLELAISAGREAGESTLAYFRQGNYQVERKGDDSPVTIADREAEQLLRRKILERFPQDAILGEEYGGVDGSSGYRWILDPIDGTKSFVSGVPLYGTLIGIERDARSVVGMIYIPGLDEMVYAASGMGAWYVAHKSATPEITRVSDCPDLSRAVVLTTQIDSFAERGAADALTRLQDAAWLTRTWGDCYGYLLVATGRAHVMIDPVLNLWDAAALQPVLEEAGGKFIDWSGKSTIHSEEGIGTTNPLFDQVMDIIRPFSKR